MSSHISRVMATRLAAAMSARSWKSLGYTTVAVTMRRKPDFDLEDLGSMIVSTVPGPVTYTTETRGMELAEVTIGVVVASHVSSEADISKMEDFEQEVLDAIRVGAVLPTQVPADTDWGEVSNPVPYDPEQLQARNVFMGQITVTFKVPLDRDTTLVEGPSGPTG